MLPPRRNTRRYTIRRGRPRPRRRRRRPIVRRSVPWQLPDDCETRATLVRRWSCQTLTPTSERLVTAGPVRVAALADVVVGFDGRGLEVEGARAAEHRLPVGP